MADARDISQLDGFAKAPFPPGYPVDRRRFFSPVDQVHEVLKTVVGWSQRSLVISMFGFDDDELAEIIKEKLEDPDITVQITLDSTQAGGVHERALLAREDYPATSIAIGRSERGAIIHLKAVVVDGLWAIGGSTNWSDSGEELQDNELVVTQNASEAAHVRDRISAIHNNVLSKIPSTIT